MRKIINFVLTFIVFYVAWECFPNQIHFEKWTDIIIVMLIMLLAGKIFSVAVIALFSILSTAWRGMEIFRFAFGAPFLSGVLFSTVASVILVLISGFLFNPVVLYFCSKYLPNFEITGGIITYILLAVALSFFTISTSNNKNNN